ncbi:MAG TPA: hypothetical protein VKE94_07130 [Gemmataceae bacterium]|jgi:hypothetical protein|nr:hypothetical protein [Gemmataceae bacterium]
MAIVCGTRLYGKVDRVPGLFYVATHFAYVQFIPLFPTASYLILDGTEGSQGFQGVKIPISGKSVLVGYLRAALCVAAGVLAGFGIANLAKDLPVGIALMAAGLACGLAFWLSYRLTRPGPQRALRLAARAGIAPEVVAQHFVGANLLKEEEHEALRANEDVAADYRERDKV